MNRLKFDDCRECRFRRRPDVCRDCDYGEQFESSEIMELSFREDEVFNRASKSLVTDEGEPAFSPDDYVRRHDQAQEDLEDDEEPDDGEE